MSVSTREGLGTNEVSPRGTMREGSGQVQRVLLESVGRIVTDGPAVLPFDGTHGPSGVTAFSIPAAMVPPHLALEAQPIVIASWRSDQAEARRLPRGRCATASYTAASERRARRSIPTGLLFRYSQYRLRHEGGPLLFRLYFGGLHYRAVGTRKASRYHDYAFRVKPPLYAITKATNYLTSCQLDNGLFSHKGGDSSTLGWKARIRP